jgi:hypothetical protein
MIQAIRSEASYLKKPWNLILNQSNVKVWNWKKNFNYTKGFKTKKIAIKRMRIKIKMQNIIDLWLKCEIKNKKQFNKR